jgi:hypothetical protein
MSCCQHDIWWLTFLVVFQGDWWIFNQIVNVSLQIQSDVTKNNYSVLPIRARHFKTSLVVSFNLINGLCNIVWLLHAIFQTVFTSICQSNPHFYEKVHQNVHFNNVLNCNLLLLLWNKFSETPQINLETSLKQFCLP